MAHELPFCDFARSLSGRDFSEEDQARLEESALVRRTQLRNELLANSLNEADAAARLGMRLDTLHDRMESESLLAVEDHGELRFPAWQFDPKSGTALVAGLPEVVREMQVSPLAKVSWLTKPNPFLDGSTPLDALKMGQGEQVIELARGVGRM